MAGNAMVATLASSPQRGDVSTKKTGNNDVIKSSPQRGDVSYIVVIKDIAHEFSPHRGDVSFPKIKFIVAPVSSTQ